MNKKMSLNDISIRTELKPGDIGYITYHHGDLYHKEFGIECEIYIAERLIEFYNNYTRIWIEHGFVSIMGKL